MLPAQVPEHSSALADARFEALLPAGAGGGFCGQEVTVWLP